MSLDALAELIGKTAASCNPEYLTPKREAVIERLARRGLRAA